MSGQSALVTLLWHGFGAHDDLMSQQRNASCPGMIPEDQRAGMPACLAAMPAGATSTWAPGVRGSLLILQRSRHAVTAFAVSLPGLIGTSLYTCVIAPASAMSGGGMALMISATILIVLLATLYHACHQVAAGILR